MFWYEARKDYKLFDVCLLVLPCKTMHTSNVNIRNGTLYPDLYDRILVDQILTLAGLSFEVYVYNQCAFTHIPSDVIIKQGSTLLLPIAVMKLFDQST